jgi:hypothetical protein
MSPEAIDPTTGKAVQNVPTVPIVQKHLVSDLDRSLKKGSECFECLSMNGKISMISTPLRSILSAVEGLLKVFQQPVEPNLEPIRQAQGRL